MKHALILSIALLAACKTDTKKMTDSFLTDKVPGNEPISFQPIAIPDHTLIHRGIFSNDFEVYYFTVSDTVFSKFDIKVSTKQGDNWSDPRDAFFNSEYNDHGMSFSHDGNTLVFSSTRPANRQDVADTWHIWKSTKKNGRWSEPEFVDIPNLRGQLMSHPTLMNDGTLYFHASNVDYSDMKIYYAPLLKRQYQNAKELSFDQAQTHGYCTPYVSADGKYLLIAKIANHLELQVCKSIGDNKWSSPINLPDIINQKGQGNPYLTPDGRYLFYAKEQSTNSWNINWVSTQSFMNFE